ncbi:hypothetical protein [Jeotgalibacillus salarius]|uniref:Uncharacterized protein n=1 Tax=Jeotgalibacillus salarius TaxID=546023 RepID=A0A4Y8LD96_9BACL|nr:hypothetical protein [Jeotgalibacillus salarius]TFE00660.1 hypothetical protein E2626_11850 [Jeotgalibacillus salarius]
MEISESVSALLNEMAMRVAFLRVVIIAAYALPYLVLRSLRAPRWLCGFVSTIITGVVGYQYMMNYYLTSL